MPLNVIINLLCPWRGKIMKIKGRKIVVVFACEISAISVTFDNIE